MYQTRTSKDRRSLLVAVFLAFGIVGYLAIARGSQGVVRTNCIPLNVAASQEKSALLTDLARTFSASAQVAGRCVEVKVAQKASGAAEEALARGWDDKADGVRPDVWSPAATSWIVLLRQHRASRDAGSGIVPDNAPSLLQSPLVIAMPRPMAEALGWPQREIGWADVLELARDKSGWGSRGHAEWGEFRLGKTNPNISTSGLHALIGAYFAATHRSSDLTEADITDPSVTDFVKGVDSAVVHYGDTVSTFVRHLRTADERGAALSYVSAIAVEEKQVLDYNRGDATWHPSMPLVAVYPKEGTLVADHPYAVLNAPWVADDDEVGLRVFSSTVSDLTPIAPIGQQRDLLKSKIGGLIAGGGTALYRTARESVTFMREAIDRSRINAVLLLTDGRNEDGDRDLDGLLRELTSEDEHRIVRVFTIGYGEDADREVLRKIADASRANFYDASNPATINKVFTDVGSNF